jgi:hypothetical protein
MSKAKKTETVTVTLQGRGHNVKAFVLGPKELQRLLSATAEDALYEDNPYSLVGSLCESAYTATHGFDPSRSNLFRCEVAMGGRSLVIEDLVFDSGDEDALEDFDPDCQLVVREDAAFALGCDLKVKKNQVIVLEAISLRDAILSASFSAPSGVALSDISLVAANLDVPTDLARASYDLDLLDGMDQDIRAVRCGELVVPLELETLNSTQSRFHLCRRVSKDEWETEFLG